MLKIIKTRAFKDRLKGHKDTVICLYSPDGPKGGTLMTSSKEGCIRGLIIFYIVVTEFLIEWDLIERKVINKILVSKKCPQI